MYDPERTVRSSRVPPADKEDRGNIDGDQGSSHSPTYVS